MDTSSIRAPASLVSEPSILGPMAQLQRPSDSYAWYSNQFYYYHSPSPQPLYPSTAIHGSTLYSVHNPYYPSPPQSYTLPSAYNTLHQPPFNYSHFLPPAAGPPTPLSFLPSSQSVTYSSQQYQNQQPPYIHQHNSYELQRLSTWKNDDKHSEHQVFDKMPEDEIFQHFKEDDQICEVVKTEGLKTVSNAEEDAMEDDIASDINIEEDRAFDAGFVMEEISKVMEDENLKSFIKPKKPNKWKKECYATEKLTSLFTHHERSLFTIMANVSVDDFLNQCKQSGDAAYGVLRSVLERLEDPRALDDMKSSGCRMGTSPFLVLIESYAQFEVYDETLDVVHWIIDEYGLKPDTHFYNRMLNLLVDGNNLKLVEITHAQMSVWGVKPDVSTFNVLIKALCKAHQLRPVILMMEDMPSYGLVPDEKTFTTIMQGFIEKGDLDGALRIREQMVECGCSWSNEMANQGEFFPDQYMFNTLVNGLCKAGHVKHAMEIMEFCFNFLEKSNFRKNDLKMEINMEVLLEIASFDGSDKQYDILLAFSPAEIVELWPAFSGEHDNMKLYSLVKCTFQGGRCSNEVKPVDRLLITLMSEYIESDAQMQSVVKPSFQQDCGNMDPLTRHLAVVHLGCMENNGTANLPEDENLTPPGINATALIHKEDKTISRELDTLDDEKNEDDEIDTESWVYSKDEVEATKDCEETAHDCSSFDQRKQQLSRILDYEAKSEEYHKAEDKASIWNSLSYLILMQSDDDSVNKIEEAAKLEHISMEVKHVVAELVCEKTKLILWFLAKIKMREFEGIKRYVSEILVILLQNSTTKKWLGQMNGVDAVLEGVAIGRILYELQLYEEALISFKRACELQPTDVRPHFRAGNCLYVLSKFKESEEEFLLALEAAESGGNQWTYMLPLIYVNLGISFEGEGMALSACEYYREAAILCPTHYRALKLLGSALFGVGEYRVAVKALEEAIFLRPDYADAHCDLASSLHALGEDERAIEVFQKATDLKPGHVDALYNLGGLYMGLGRFQRASELYTKVSANLEVLGSVLEKLTGEIPKELKRVNDSNAALSENIIAHNIISLDAPTAFPEVQPVVAALKHFLAF